MPKKKKVQVNTLTGNYHVEVKENATKEEIIEAVKETATCNHQNKHYTAGELRCVLPLKHGGDHFGYVNGNPTAWSDAAGTPARKHA